MALIAMFSYLFSSFVVYQAVAEKNLTGKNCYICQLSKYKNMMKLKV